MSENVPAEEVDVNSTSTQRTPIDKAFDSPALFNKRIRKGAVGTNAIDSIQKWAIGLKPYELQFPQNMRTFHEMYTRDESVGGVLNATYTFVENAFQDWRVIPNKNDPESVKIAKYLTYCFSTMRGTMREFSRSAATFNQFGFSVIEKDYRRLNLNHYDEELPKGLNIEDAWQIDKLRFIPQRSLDPSEPFIIANGGRDILAARQNPAWFLNSAHSFQYTTPAVPAINIGRNKFMLMGINVTGSTPMGVSPLEQIWTYWKEKKFYEDYQSVGVSKDMAGMPLLRLPVEILNKANADPTSPEGMMVAAMCNDVAAMHAGEQNFMFLPSDAQPNSSNMTDYNLEFLGISGQGKQFDLQEIINKRREAIYSSFGALNLISNESKGGYNQLEGQNNIHHAFITNTIHTIEDCINNDLIPQLLALNNIPYTVENLPKFKAGDIAAVSLDEIGKFIQRVASVGMLPSTPAVFNEVLAKGGFDYRIDENMSQEELQEISTGDSSRAGESKGSSGTGDSQMVSGGNNNLENKSDEKLKFDARGWYRNNQQGDRIYLSKEEIDTLDI
ncbi:portal protein [Vibrio phage 1.101.O._10N.261.45.C6]|nr:portal protein [Vibrio phage 1.101.O._10N.261.45.C6]